MRCQIRRLTEESIPRCMANLLSYRHRAAGSIFVTWISRCKNCAKMVDVRCEYCGNIISAHSDDFAAHLQLESPRGRPTISASMPIIRKNVGQVTGNVSGITRGEIKRHASHQNI